MQGETMSRQKMYNNKTLNTDLKISTQPEKRVLSLLAVTLRVFLQSVFHKR